MKIKMHDTVTDVVPMDEGKVVLPVDQDGNQVLPVTEPLIRRGKALVQLRLNEGVTYDKVDDTWARELVRLKLARRA